MSVEIAFFHRGSLIQNYGTRYTTIDENGMIDKTTTAEIPFKYFRNSLALCWIF